MVYSLYMSLLIRSMRNSWRIRSVIYTVIINPVRQHCFNFALIFMRSLLTWCVDHRLYRDKPRLQHKKSWTQSNIHSGITINYWRDPDHYAVSNDYHDTSWRRCWHIENKWGRSRTESTTQWQCSHGTYFNINHFIGVKHWTVIINRLPPTLAPLFHSLV